MKYDVHGRVRSTIDSTVVGPGATAYRQSSHPTVSCGVLSNQNSGLNHVTCPAGVLARVTSGVR